MTTAPPGGRIGSIDWLRGLVIASMTIDHVREFFASTRLPDPMDVQAVSPALFFTRWITHICAPTFVLLTGLSASLGSRAGGSVGPLSRHLLVRGLWLVLLELTVIAWSWSFSFRYPNKFLSVIWAIGMSLVALSALVHLPRAAIGVVGLAIVAGHDLLDGIRVAPGSPWHIPWAMLHQRDTFPLGDWSVRVSYPILPWIGVAALGYWLGSAWFRPDVDASQRRRWLGTAGVACLASFLVLRTLSVYGDPSAFRVQDSAVRTLMSFVNTTKYGPSLQFLLMTLGPALLLLRWSESLRGAFADAFQTLGRVPLFYYVLHWYWIHVLAVVAALAWRGDPWSSLDFANKFAGLREPLQFPLPVVYAVTAVVVASLYPLCRALAAVKARSHGGWLSYV